MDLFEDKNDEARMNALYIPFRIKSVNPEGYINKMNTWMSVIDKYCTKRRKITFTLKDLEVAFERNHQKPQCLDIVMQEMLKNKQIMKRNDFETSLSSWSAWSFNVLVKKPISWGWSFIAESVFGPNEPAQIQYINEAAFKEAASLVLEKLENIANTTNTCAMQEVRAFHNKSTDLCPDFEVFKLILTHLNSLKKIVLHNEGGQTYVKLLGHQSDAARPTQFPVTKVDLGVVKLRNALEQVQNEIENIESEMTKLRTEAGVLVRDGKQSKAKALLIKKQRLDVTLKQKLKSAENIEAMLFQLENSVTNKGVIDALKAGVQAHKEAAGSGMSIDKIDETLNDIEDAFEEHKEISEAMGRGITGFDTDFKDEDLEEELDMLLELDKMEIKNKTPEVSFDESRLPEVPQTEITADDNVQVTTTTTSQSVKLPTQH